MTGRNDAPDTAACCSVCWALVPPTMMHFHRTWHDEVERGAAAAALARMLDRPAPVV